MESFNVDDINFESVDEIESNHISTPDFDTQPVWRSLAVAPGSSYHEFDASLRGFVEPIQLIQTPKCSNSSSSRRLAPEPPYYITPTNFKLPAGDVDDIVDDVSRLLGGIPEVSFEYSGNSCEWNAVYMRSSSCCKFQVHVYSNPSCGTHIVEFNRLSGDGSAFRTVWNEVRSQMDPKHSSSSDGMPGVTEAFSVAPLPCQAPPLTDSCATEALKSIIQMCKSTTMESQVEGSHMLCQLSSLHDLQQLLCDTGCVQVLVELQSSEWEIARQNAIFALANLSDLPMCQSLIIESGIVLELVKLATDGTYYTAELRREGARIIANVCSRLAAQVVAVGGPGPIATWLQSIDTLKDSRVKYHAGRAKQSLMRAMAVQTA